MGSLPGLPAAVANKDKGFNDPAGVYPVEAGESDINKLARGTQTHTYTPDSTISEPADPYNAVYPHNKVYATKSHIREYDDTAGAERIREQHKSGTFYQIHPNGDKSTHIVNDNYTVIAGKDSIHVSGNVLLQIDSNCTTNIAGDWDVNVTGNATIDAATINLNSGTKGAARIGDTADTGDDPAGISAGDGSNQIETGSSTVFIGG